MRGGSAMAEKLRGKLLMNEPLSKHTTWQVGGPADLFYVPADIADLCAFIAGYCHEHTPVYVIGRGSNLLVRDGGVRGIVVCTEGSLNQIRVLDGHRLNVEAGVTSARVAQFSTKNGMTGCEFLAGVPGSFGGALAMNAGAYGGETWACVESVETVDRNGVLRTRVAAEYDVAYRSVSGPEDEWFVAATLQLKPGDMRDGKRIVRGFMEQRNASQPVKLANAGSVFRNPPGDHAARLIESCGLKGRRRGMAVVSEQHANFIVNKGGATAADIESVIELVEQTVKRDTGVQLVREVKVIGEAEQ